jgi:hypothetical protein
MRWKTKARPRDFDQRTVTRFLWFPLCFFNEWRWLETAKIYQYYKPASYPSLAHWEDHSWDDQELISKRP